VGHHVVDHLDRPPAEPTQRAVILGVNDESLVAGFAHVHKTTVMRPKMIPNGISLAMVMRRAIMTILS